jgi:hypothetical protein
MNDASKPISYEEFLHRAEHLITAPPEILEQLYPMVCDVLAMANDVNRFAHAMDAEMDVASLSETVSGEA